MGFWELNVSRTKKCPTSILILELDSSNCWREIYHVSITKVSRKLRLEENCISSKKGSNKMKHEKYKGDALLQKEFTVDFLQHKTKKNEGEESSGWNGKKEENR